MCKHPLYIDKNHSWYGLLITVGGVGGDFSQTPEYMTTVISHGISYLLSRQQQ